MNCIKCDHDLALHRPILVNKVSCKYANCNCKVVRTKCEWCSDIIPSVSVKLRFTRQFCDYICEKLYISIQKKSARIYKKPILDDSSPICDNITHKREE